MSKTYRLTDDELRGIARLCWQEQGSVDGAAAEASLMCNRYEMYNNQRYSSLYGYVRGCGWWAKAGYYMDEGYASDVVISAVRRVLEGARTLPEYIDEHDCLSDIHDISTGDVDNRDDYIKDVTRIYNNYGSEYTFYCFPAIGADPFGYTGERKGSLEMEVERKCIAEDAAQWMENLAEDDAHGYDQAYRWGEKGDYDCSSAVISAYEAAGVPVKEHGATYTGDMKRAFLACGFKDVTGQINLSAGLGLERGDVLLNEVHHTAMYLGGGMEAEASVNEKGTATGGKPGDQTGKEILIRSYRNFPWDCVLRYYGSGEPVREKVKVKKGAIPVPYVRRGCTGYMVSMLQFALNLICGTGLDVDGEFGSKTEKALKEYQKQKDIQVNGICGRGVWKQIMYDIGEKTYTE